MISVVVDTTDTTVSSMQLYQTINISQTELFCLYFWNSPKHCTTLHYLSIWPNPLQPLRRYKPLLQQLLRKPPPHPHHLVLVSHLVVICHCR